MFLFVFFVCMYVLFFICYMCFIFSVLVLFVYPFFLWLLVVFFPLVFRDMLHVAFKFGIFILSWRAHRPEMLKLVKQNRMFGSKCVQLEC